MELTFEEMDSEQSDFRPRREVMCCPCPPPPCYSPCGPSVDIVVLVGVGIQL
jgi:hypothetical protein